MASGNLGPVYLKIGQRVRRARHVELSFEGIQKAFEDTFGIAEHNIAARIGDFRLRVPPGVWVTDFDPVTDVKPFSGETRHPPPLPSSGCHYLCSRCARTPPARPGTSLVRRFGRVVAPSD